MTVSFSFPMCDSFYNGTLAIVPPGTAMERIAAQFTRGGIYVARKNSLSPSLHVFQVHQHSHSCVGFVGLVTPHILRMLGARDHRVLIPASALLGGSIVLIADTLARTILAPQQLPVGIFTAIIGVPCFLFIMNSSGKKFS